MRKSSMVAVLGLCFLMVFVSGIAEKCFAGPDVLSTLTGKKGPSKKDDAARDALRKMILEKKGELNGSSWSIKIDSQAKKGELLGEDTLVFQNDKFLSERANKIGYASTNYTLTVQEAGPTIWETMQTSKKGEVCFWRGEWKEDVMTGIISRQLEKGAEEYYFTSSSRKEIPKTTEEKEEAQINPLQETPKEMKTSVLGGANVPTPKAVPVKAKKKGWF
ncbi:MAG: hypothetical protein ABH891_06565 [Candidatus Omnitrophota bacterium]